MVIELVKVGNLALNSESFPSTGQEDLNICYPLFEMTELVSNEILECALSILTKGQCQ